MTFHVSSAQGFGEPTEFCSSVRLKRGSDHGRGGQRIVQGFTDLSSLAWFVASYARFQHTTNDSIMPVRTLLLGFQDGGMQVSKLTPAGFSAGTAQKWRGFFFEGSVSQI